MKYVTPPVIKRIEILPGPSTLSVIKRVSSGNFVLQSLSQRVSGVYEYLPDNRDVKTPVTKSILSKTRKRCQIP